MTWPKQSLDIPTLAVLCTYIRLLDIPDGESITDLNCLFASLEKAFKESTEQAHVLCQS